MPEVEETVDVGLTPPPEDDVGTDDAVVEESVEATEDAVSDEAAPGPEPVADAAIPDWMNSVISPVMPLGQDQESATDQDIPNPFAAIEVLDEDSQRILNEAVQAEIAKHLSPVEARANEAQKAIDEQKQREAENAVLHTRKHLYNKFYNDQFKNDPDLQGNKELAEKLDSTIQNYMQKAEIAAVQFGDFTDLNIANHPKFGKLMSMFAKEIADVPQGRSEPIAVKGAVVESSTPNAKGASDIPAEVRKELKNAGISLDQYRKDLKAADADFSYLDSDD